jgi:methionyl-tRNA formyltransferase
MNIVIIGRTEALYDAAEILFKEGHRIKLVVTAKESPESKKTAEDFKRLAKRIKAKFIYTPSIGSNDYVKIIKKMGELDIGISINYVNILPRDFIKLFKHGILNAHMGDLPRYRGNACPNWAILNGEKSVTLSIHLMEPGELDSGTILLQRKYILKDNTTITDVYKFFGESAPQMFSQAIKGIASKTVKFRPQPKKASLSLRCYPRQPNDSLIDWSKDAVYLSRLVRASTEPFSGAYTYLKNKKVFILEAYPVVYPCPSLAIPGQVLWRLEKNGEVAVACGKDVLVLRKMRFEGDKLTEASNVINSLRIRLGIDFEEKIQALRKRIEYLEKALRKKLR